MTNRSLPPVAVLATTLLSLPQRPRTVHRVALGHVRIARLDNLLLNGSEVVE